VLEIFKIHTHCYVENRLEDSKSSINTRTLRQESHERDVSLDKDGGSEK
jgi:hypothetical protein